MADPDRQELVAVRGLQEDDRLLADQIETDAVDEHLLHPSGDLVSNIAQPGRPETAVSRPRQAALGTRAPSVARGPGIARGDLPERGDPPDLPPHGGSLPGGPHAELRHGDRARP